MPASGQSLALPSVVPRKGRRENLADTGKSAELQTGSFEDGISGDVLKNIRDVEWEGTSLDRQNMKFSTSDLY